MLLTDKAAEQRFVEWLSIKHGVKAKSTELNRLAAFPAFMKLTNQ